MPTLSEVAVMSGFYDQAHLAPDWNDLIGCPPSEWLATEDLPFVQDSDARSEAPWEVRTIYEAVGGADAVLALAEAWHARCLADPILSSWADLGPG